MAITHDALDLIVHGHPRSKPQPQTWDLIVHGLPPAPSLPPTSLDMRLLTHAQLLQAGVTHSTRMLSCYRPQTKLWEGNVFTGASLFRWGLPSTQLHGAGRPSSSIDKPVPPSLCKQLT